MSSESQTRAEAVAQAARSRAEQVAESITARTDQVVEAVKERADQAVEAAKERADQALNSTGERLSDAGAKLWENAPGGPLGEVLGAAAASLESTGEYLAGSDVKQLTSDVAGFIHKHPVECVVLGLFAGGLVGMALTRLRGGRRA